MSMNNDERILELRKQIELKKEKLGKNQRFLPTTNCSLELDEKRYNINVLDKDSLTHLMVKLNALLMSAKQLNIADTYSISGYNVEDWIGDIQLKLNMLSRADEARALKAMETKLTTLLSERKKVELEIDEIEGYLKG